MIKMNKGMDEFHSIVGDLLQHEDVQQLNNFHQHMNTSRLDHCLNVSYISYRACKRLGLDYRSAARAGLLHDLFLYDWRVEKQPEGAHAFAHPIVALRNAKNIAELNHIEEDAILNHMWPVTRHMPSYAESMLVSWADKYSTCLEVAAQVRKRTKDSLLSMRKSLFATLVKEM